jgi:hypothetical protein
MLFTTIRKHTIRAAAAIAVTGVLTGLSVSPTTATLAQDGASAAHSTTTPASNQGADTTIALTSFTVLSAAPQPQSSHQRHPQYPYPRPREVRPKVAEIDV